MKIPNAHRVIISPDKLARTFHEESSPMRLIHRYTKARPTLGGPDIPPHEHDRPDTPKGDANRDQDKHIPNRPGWLMDKNQGAIVVHDTQEINLLRNDAELSKEAQ